MESECEWPASGSRGWARVASGRSACPGATSQTIPIQPIPIPLPAPGLERPAARATEIAVETSTERLLGRVTLGALVVATGVLYLWGLGASGWANAYYSAAAHAGSQDWKAFFFGSSDAGNASPSTRHRRRCGRWRCRSASSGSLVEHARAAGAQGVGDGRPAVRDGAAGRGRPPA